MTDPIKGILAMVLACTIWGLSPLYYAELRHVPALDVLAWRTAWSCIFFMILLAVQGRLGLVGRALGTVTGALTVLAAGLMIATNWFGFIYSIQIGRAVEASLGYYIFPLVAVLLGRLVFAEALARAQWLAVALAALAVIVLTLGLGAAPWISLLLAATFAGYGVVKKRLDVGPVVSVTAEVLLLSPIAVLWLAGPGDGVSWDLRTHLLFALSGPLTASPLILFSYAARRVKLSTIGLVQYLNPTLQFLVATLIFLEPFTFWHALAFPMIWLALAIYSVTSLRQDRAARRASSSVAVSSTVET